MMSKKRRLVLFIILLGALAIALHAFSMKNSTIQAQGTRQKQFTSIKVKQGESLWTIAKEHMGEEYDSVNDYIDEVCETNHIYDGKITDGMYIVIPYYK